MRPRRKGNVSDRRPARGKIYDDNKLRPSCGEQDYKKAKKKDRESSVEEEEEEDEEKDDEEEERGNR